MAPDQVADTEWMAPPTQPGGFAAGTPSDQTGLIPAAADEDAAMIPGFASGQSQLAAATENRERRGVGAAVGAAVLAGVVVVAVIAVLVAGRIAHRDTSDAVPGKNAALNPTGSVIRSGAASPASGPGATRAATHRHGRTQAWAIAAYLTRSRQVRHDIGAAITAISGCTDVTSAVTTLQHAAAVRTRIATALASTHAGALPHGAVVVDNLRRAMRASANADRHYAAWGQDVAGCHRHAPRDAEFAAAQRSDTRATATKRRFAAEWNLIAAMYGLAKQSANTI